MTWGRRRRVEPDDWRGSASEEDLREYDAFGPWVYEINAERDAPKRFRAACASHYDARFLLKVPRNVERRDVRPGMDLYDAVLAVHDHGASLMRLTDERVVTQDLVWGEVAALESYKDLLYSRLTLMLRDGGAFALEYSSVSSALMRKVTDFVRSQWTRDREAPRAFGPDPVVAIADLVFQNELDAKRRSGPQPVAPIHAEPANRYCRDAANRRRLSTGVMFLDAPGELIIVNRNEPTRRFLEARYAVNCVFVPYAGLTSFSLASPPAGRATRFHEVTLRLDKQVIRQSCLVAPERVLARLAAHGAPQTND
jgi:hypothetical protein